MTTRGFVEADMKEIADCIDTVLGATPDLHVAETLCKLLGEFVGDRLVHVEAVRCDARLADVAHLRDDRLLDRMVEVGVGEDEVRRVAAELHRHPQQVL